MDETGEHDGRLPEPRRPIRNRSVELVGQALAEVSGVAIGAHRRLGNFEAPGLRGPRQVLPSDESYRRIDSLDSAHVLRGLSGTIIKVNGD